MTRVQLVGLAQAGIAQLMRENIEAVADRGLAIDEFVPHNDRARGYLLGLVEGVLAEFSGLSPTPVELSALLRYAFVLLTGSDCENDAMATVRNFHTCNDDIIVGALLGRREAVTARETGVPAQGLASLLAGDDDAIRAAISPR